MKKLSRSALIVICATVLAANAANQGLAAPGNHDDWRSPVPGADGSLFQVDSQRIPPEYDLVLLALGRSVYEDLQRARQAALNRESTNLRVAVQEALETLRRLQLPEETRLLEKQLQIIRRDLKDRSKELDKAVWVPAEAGIDAGLVYVPEDEQAAARQGINKAGTVAEGERESVPERVPEQLDVVTPTLKYGLGIFPLARVMEDLEAAHASASLSEPDWTGSLEAVQAALATFHWFTRLPSHGLLSAYNDAVNAYVLAAGPAIREDQRWKILQYLDRAERALGNTPDGRMLAGKVRALVDRGEPQGSDIRSLLNEIQSRIRSERQHAEVSYWQSIGPDTPE